MKKRITAILAALSLTACSALCGCDTGDKPAGNSKSDKNQSSSAVSDQTDISEKPSKEGNVYADFLGNQDLCSISKNFSIPEPGTVKDNPLGLAGAVKYDFDNDNTEELLTFTFERNSKSQEDMRIDLLKLKDGQLDAIDSKYLIELLDLDHLDNKHKQDSLYFSDRTTLQIVTSEYNGKMYLGCMLSEAPLLDGIDYKYSTYSVMSFENNEIVPQTIGVYYFGGLHKEAYNKIIPESMKSKLTLEKKDDPNQFQRPQMIKSLYEYTLDAGKYLLYARNTGDEEHYYEIGAYDSLESGFSDMLNEFGLDIDPATSDSFGKFVSKNNSEIKTICQIEQLKSLIPRNDYKYQACKLTLDSDLEEIIGNESPFCEPLADELAAYEDVLKYPFYYSDIWEPLMSAYPNDSEFYVKYFVADINKDQKYELVLTAGDINNNELIRDIVAVTPDLSAKNHIGGDYGTPCIFDNGIIKKDIISSDSAVYYMDINTSEQCSGYKNAPESDGSRTMEITINDKTYKGEEAHAEMNKLESGTVLNPEYISYDFRNPESFKELTVIKNTDDIKQTWQKAYLSQCAPYADETIMGGGYKYALLELDTCDAPLLIITITDSNDNGGGGLFSYAGGQVNYISGLSSRCIIEGYNKKEGLINIGFHYTPSIDGNAIFNLENGNITETTDFEHDGDSNTYLLNNETISKDEYEKKRKSYLDNCGDKLKTDYYSYEEFCKLLNGEKAVPLD